MKRLVGLFLLCALITLGLPLTSSGQSQLAHCPFNLGLEAFLSDPTGIQLDNDSLPVRIPLKRVGNLFFIEAMIDSMIGNFVLDLGAPYLVLNATYFRDYEVDQTYYSGTMLSGEEFVKRTWIRKLNIQGVEYSRLLADITDLSEIENRKGIKILGLLGVDIFRKFAIDLDVLNKQLVLWPRKLSPQVDAKLLFEVPIWVKNSVILMTLKSGKVLLNFSLDTGAETNIMHNGLRKKVYNGMKILGSSSMTDGNGGQTEVLMAVIGGLTAGEKELKRMRTLILNLETMSRAYGKRIDGMLGYPFFSTGRILIDFTKKKLFVYQYKKRD